MLGYDASGAVLKLRAIVKNLKPCDHVAIELVQGSDEFCTVQSVEVSLEDDGNMGSTSLGLNSVTSFMTVIIVEGALIGSILCEDR